MRKASPSAIRIPLPTPGPSKLQKSSASASIGKLSNAVGAEQERRWSSGMERNGSGIWSPNTFPEPGRLSTSTMLGNISGRSRANCIPRSKCNRKAWMKVHQKRLLDKGKIEKLVSELHSIATTNPQLAEKIRTEAVYFERNAERMRYPRFRRQHLFVGSGVIEAGCKTVVGSRLKQSGMFWTVRGANAILALRCSHLNGRFEDYWEERQEVRAA